MVVLDSHYETLDLKILLEDLYSKYNAERLTIQSGGKVKNLFGNDQRYDQSIKGAVVSNGKVHNEVVNIIKKYINEV